MISFLVFVPILLFSVVAHEYAHAWTAYRQGDPTAYMLGRLTMNPLPHIDPLMSVIVPLGLWVASHGAFTFGAARPVPVNPQNFRRFRRGELIVSSAGIVMNLAIALVCAAVFVLLGMAGSYFLAARGELGTVQRMVFYGIVLNYVLAFFNLLPIPPLDGSHIFYPLVPAAWRARLRRIGRYPGMLLVVAVLLIPGASNVILFPAFAASGLTYGLVAGFSLPGALPELGR